MTSKDVDRRSLLDRGAAFEIAAISQLVTALEARTDLGLSMLEEVYANTGRAHIVGITGAPGSGKSTLTSAIAKELRSRGLKIAIVAVDPSSSISGGAILGDRIRMSEHALDPGIFVRSMSSRGRLGGVSRATVDAVAVFDATGWDVVIVETVGVGQSDVEVVKIAQTTIVVSVPGLGDDIQTIKSGLLEVADLHVVNKYDLPGAHRTMRDLLTMLMLASPSTQEGWTIPVLGTSATRGEGIVELVDTLSAHRDWLRTSGELQRRERSNAEARIRLIAKDIVLQGMRDPAFETEFEHIVDQVANRKLSPYAAAEKLLFRIAEDESPTRSTRHE